MIEEKSIAGEFKQLSFLRSLILKTLVPTLIVIFLVIGIFGIYISTKTKENSKEFLIQNMLMPEFELLAKEKNNDFERIKDLTEYTAQKVEERIAASKNRTNEEVEALFNRYVSKKPDGSYRSNLDESRGRFQMAAFHNNLEDINIREKGIFVDAFLFFNPFCESQMPFVFTTYFATKNSIWQYGFPDWALTSAANETFDKYGWFYEADSENDPDRKQVWTDMYFDEFQGQWEISSLMPIYDGKEFLGIVGQDFILQKIIEITKKSNIGQTGILFFVDNLGNIVAHPDTEFLMGKKAKNDERLNLKMLPDSALIKVLQNVPNENGFNFTEEKNRRIVMYFPLKSANWKMIYEINEEDILRIVTQTNTQYLTSFVLFALFVIVLIFLIINFMVIRPIRKLTEVTNDISKGNLNKKIDVKSKDEVGELASAFNRMISDLKISRNKLEDYTTNLEKRVKSRTKQLDKKIKESEKNRIATLNILEDVEETRRKLAKTYRELKELDKIKVEFMNMAAHELKTPLIPIIGYLDMIIKGEMGKITEKEKESLLIAFRSAERLQRLISDILDISKLESDIMKYNVETVDLGTLINNLVESMKPFANEKKIKLISKIDKKLPLFKGDMSKLTEVFENLINNAIKFTNKGEVVVESKVNEKNMIISVRDTGIGMSKEFAKKKVFEKFQQENTTERRKYGGTGLGLAICKKIVEYYKGKIWVKSELGKGSTFYVSLPIKK